MTLPSSRRPKDLEELELEEGFIKPIVSSTPSIPRLRINLPKIFLEIMVTWYENLAKRDKGRLTPTKLKRKALLELSKLNFEYESLPLTWVHDLKRATGMILYKRIKADFTRDFEGIGPIAVKVGPGLRSEGTSTQFMDTSFCPKTEPEPNKEKIVDLSDAPPPAEWIAAYREGRHPPRMLTTCMHEGKIVHFYDYDPKFTTEDGQPCGEFDVHDGNNMAFLQG